MKDIINMLQNKKNDNKIQSLMASEKKALKMPQKYPMNYTTTLTQPQKNPNKNWKNKTSKLTRIFIPKIIHSNIDQITQNYIDQLFFHQWKSKYNSTQTWDKVYRKQLDGGNQRDFLKNVQFLHMEDFNDQFLSGLPNSHQIQNYPNQTLLQQNKIQDLTVEYKKNYLVGQVIGQGAYATVRVAIYKPKKLKIAIKTYQKLKIKQIQRKRSVRRQIKILQHLHHPNIVRIYDVIQTNNHINIAMQYLSGHSLDIYLKAQPYQKISQKVCKKIFIQLVNALAYMHSLNISHRDIKLQNIILNQDFCPKLIDFGFSTCIQSNQKTKIFCGTPSYMAPEVVQRKQYRGQDADVWALGVLLFVSLTGVFPFKGQTDQELFKKIRESDYPKNQMGVSKMAGDLIAKMLKVNPMERITACQIGNHCWFNENRSESSKKKRGGGSSNQGYRRISTNNQNLNGEIYEKLKLRKNTNQIKFIEKQRKSVLAEPSKINNKRDSKIHEKSPKNISIQKTRKQIQNKQNLKQRYLNKKNISELILKQKLNRQNIKNKQLLKKKQKFYKTHLKIIQLFHPQKKIFYQSKSNTHRN